MALSLNNEETILSALSLAAHDLDLKGRAPRHRRSQRRVKHVKVLRQIVLDPAPQLR